MLIQDIARFYHRDIGKMIGEVGLFEPEANLWVTGGTVTNTAGNLALHIAGGLDHYFGAVLSGNGYLRDRPAEFARRNVAREELVAGLENARSVVDGALAKLSDEDLVREFPVHFDGAANSTGYVLVQLLAHLNYHLGQVNYLRRLLEPAA